MQILNSFSEVKRGKFNIFKTRSYYRKQNAADMYMQDVLQPKSVFFTVCMI